MLDLYLIEGTSNICPCELHSHEYNTVKTWPTFKEDYIKLKNIIIEHVNKNIPFIIMRVFDGEFYFLKCKSIGNIPKRHCSKKLTPTFIKKFKDGCYKVDLLCTQLYYNQMIQYAEIFNDRSFDFPMEMIYGMVANKWIFSNFKNQIGIMGGTEKINVIKKLMEKEEYRQFLQIDYFTDYIDIPERFSCDDTESLINNIGKKLENSNKETKIYLFGMGIAKMAIAYRFKDYYNAVYIDIGCGVSALAGTVSLGRPYFGSWINYRLNNYDYSKMDQTDYNDTMHLNQTIFLK